MTMRYSHLSPGHKRKAVHVLDRLMEENENDVSKKWYKNVTIAEGETSLDCPKSLGVMVPPRHFNLNQILGELENIYKFRDLMLVA
jgi:hypothetical protein